VDAPQGAASANSSGSTWVRRLFLVSCPDCRLSPTDHYIPFTNHTCNGNGRGDACFAAKSKMTILRNFVFTAWSLILWIHLRLQKDRIQISPRKRQIPYQNWHLRPAHTILSSVRTAMTLSSATLGLKIRSFGVRTGKCIISSFLVTGVPTDTCKRSLSFVAP
jgi:hypothetical protein